jgi:uncharacterized protein (TIGR04255 family)
MIDIPGKLKQDAIVEAVAEIRFEHSLVQELVIGRLAASREFSDYSSARLPIADLPLAIRENDPNLRFQPTLQLQRQSPGEVLKIGPRVISIHNLAPYIGWGQFKTRISTMVAALGEAVGEIQVNRVGLRYVNSLSASQGFPDIQHLNITFEIAGERPTGEVTIAYRNYNDTGMMAQVTLASPVLVEGLSLPGSVAFVDVDVSSRSPLGKMTRDGIEAWFTSAHEFEKREFFRLWPEETLMAQRVD